jgi:trehalose 6-phosphate synthase
MDLSENSHLIVVSNRLPVTINKDGNGEYHFKMSSGGLVSALSGFKKAMNFTWIGWPGFFIPVKDRPHVDKRLMEEYSCQAVYLDDDLADRHYNGFSNSILWPLFHYHPGEMNFDEENWQAYRQANFQFAEAVRRQITPGAMVWVQDYHLMMLPMQLRGLVDGRTDLGDFKKNELPRVTETAEGKEPLPVTKVPGIKIGFFLHTPFPSSEIYRCDYVWIFYLNSVLNTEKNLTCPAGDPLGYPLLRSHWLPHLRLCSSFPFLVHAYPWSAYHAKRGRIQRAIGTRWNVPNWYRTVILY